MYVCTCVCVCVCVFVFACVHAGLQYRTTDGFHNNPDIDSPYLDGVSITHGSPGSRKHIWSFGIGAYQHTHHGCPCSQRGGNKPPAFVGNDYYCESGHSNANGFPHQWDIEKLWDGKCYAGNCCKAKGMPYFNKTLGASTTDRLEVRLCKDQDNNDEDLAIERMELFIR